MSAKCKSETHKSGKFKENPKVWENGPKNPDRYIHKVYLKCQHVPV